MMLARTSSHKRLYDLRNLHQKFGRAAVWRQPAVVFNLPSKQHRTSASAVTSHVLVAPKRVVPRFLELTAEEVCDLWCLVHSVGAAIEKHYEGRSLTLAIQDGPYAGQTVPHVHVHILPRRPGDFENNDDVYGAIDDSAKDMAMLQKGKKLDLDKQRVVRSAEDMAQEAARLRTLFS